MLQLRTILYTKVNKKAFTLAELLVVVAIIAILVAVSIPIFSGKLEEVRKNTDLANVRAAKAAAVVEYLSDDNKGAGYFGYYDADKGIMVSNPKGIKGYNQLEQFQQSTISKIKREEGAIMVLIDEKVGQKPTVTMVWHLIRK